MKIRHIAAAAAFAVSAFAVPASAQIASGATVYSPTGAEVGKVQAVEGDNVVLNTGNMTAALPSSAFGEGEKGPTIAWEKADLEAAITASQQQSTAALDAALVAGTEVVSADGVALGTVSSVGEGGNVVIDHKTAGSIQLPKAQFALNQDKLTFAATAAELDAAIGAQAGS